MQKLTILLVSIGLFSGSVQAQEKLVFAIDVIRHGDRTPVQDNLNPPYQWSQGLGQLTPLGVEQEQQLGALQRQWYVDQYHLLPPSYQADLMYVRSTDYERTLKSAKAFLQGLYPQSANIPIHTMPLADDTLMMPLSDEERRALERQYVASAPDWQAKQAQLAPQFPTWSKALGVPIHNLFQMWPIADTLEIRRSQGAPMPALSEAQINTIIDTGFWENARVMQNHALGYANAHSLLLEIDRYLMNASEAKTPLKYVLFSGHDVTLLGLMSDLYAPASIQAPYASDLKFLLFENDQHQYTVQVTYNGQSLNIPACGGNVCPLAKFVAID